MSNNEFGKVLVLGTDITRPPLLNSPDARIILIKDKYEDPMILLVRILSNDTWGLVTKNDPEWSAMLLKYGFNSLSTNVSLKDIMTDGIDKYTESKQ